MSITVLKPGLQTTIQSRPRDGLRHLGVPASGAADPLSMALANRLVGNDLDVPLLEAALLGPTLRFDADSSFALVGAPVAARLNGRAVALHEAVSARRGDVLETAATEQGARLYIAFAGGLHADVVLGSPATYLPASLGGLEGRALEAGDVIATGARSAKPLRTPREFRPAISGAWALRACPGPECDGAAADLFDVNWTVGQRADRMGLQLEGPTLAVSSGGRMPSAAVFPGTVQCPENGSPFVLSVDAGTVGGYPRIAQIARVDRHLLGQLRPGDHVRFLERDSQAAIDELRQMHDYWREWLPDIDAVI